MSKKEKKSQKNIALPTISIGDIFRRFHAVIFTIITCGGLAVAVFLLNNILNDSTATTQPPTSPTSNTTFDTQTLERVEQLRPLSEQPQRPELPQGRTDPF